MWNPAIFGEFNPGHGLNVAEGELGQLNLSGYPGRRDDKTALSEASTWRNVI